MGSLSGALASQKVTEAFEGRLAPDGNRSDRAKPYGGFTARGISRAVAKAEVSDPTVRNRTAEAHRIKATPGITGWWCPRGHIDDTVRTLDVGSSHPGGEEAPKGLAVRQLKRYVSWVQTVVRQVGLYLLQAWILEGSLL